VIEEVRNPAFLWDKGASLSDIVNAINRLNVSPGDLVAILEALSQAGSLSAELVVI
jgi:flagellar P-ring protein precursor FlgI